MIAERITVADRVRGSNMRIRHADQAHSGVKQGSSAEEEFLSRLCRTASLKKFGLKLEPVCGNHLEPGRRGLRARDDLEGERALPAERNTLAACPRVGRSPVRRLQFHL